MLRIREATGVSSPKHRTGMLVSRPAVAASMPRSARIGPSSGGITVMGARRTSAKQSRAATGTSRHSLIRRGTASADIHQLDPTARPSRTSPRRESGRPRAYGHSARVPGLTRCGNQPRGWEDADMSDSDVREVLTWEMFGTASRELAQQVCDSGFQPDLILSIARGGLFAAGAVSYALGIKNLHVMNVEFYTDVEARLPMPVVLTTVPMLCWARSSSRLAMVSWGATVMTADPFVRSTSEIFILGRYAFQLALARVPTHRCATSRDRPDRHPCPR